MTFHFWGINYHPEVTGISPYTTSWCEWLAKRGHTVKVFTTFSYYPSWKKRPEDRGRLYRTDRINGVAVHRCWHYVPDRPGPLKRMLHEASFVLTSALRLLVAPRADLVVVVSPPLLLGCAAWLVCGLRRMRFVFHVQDLQPDAAAGLGMIRPGRLLRLLYGLERLAYRTCWRLSGISQGMLEAFREKGIPAEKVLHLPNWVDDGVLDAAAEAVDDREAGFAFRRRLGVSEETLLLVYSGNLGVKQGLDILLEAARRNEAAPPGERIPVEFVLAGEGASKADLEERAKAWELGTVRFLPLQDEPSYRALLEAADFCLVTQQAGTGRYFFPSKLLTLLMHGRPVLTVADADGELAAAVAEGGFGVNVPPGAPAALLHEVQAWAGRRAELPALGSRGREWVSRFRRSRVLADWLQAIETGDAAGPGRAGESGDCAAAANRQH
ncbi:MAG: colanic acid biosynthesis glycosyltransferase WcaI [Puniceicoccaceae bacterium]|nr:MAG: colanic acid biosynthesis glycosyltransferase WcaI [Puniceicoccaceae bacterium]